MPCRATEAEVSSGHAEPKSQVGATERRRGSQGPQGMPGVPSHDHPGSRPDVADQRRSLATRHTPNPTTFVDVASLAPTFRVQTHHSAAERERTRQPRAGTPHPPNPAGHSNPLNPRCET